MQGKDLLNRKYVQHATFSDSYIQSSPQSICELCNRQVTWSLYAHISVISFRHQLLAVSAAFWRLFKQSHFPLKTQHQFSADSWINIIAGIIIIHIFSKLNLMKKISSFFTTYIINILIETCPSIQSPDL